MRQRNELVKASIDPGATPTIFGIDHTGCTLGKSAKMKLLETSFSKHTAEAQRLFKSEELEDGISRSVRPFNFRCPKHIKGISQTQTPRLGVSRDAIKTALRKAGAEGVKRQADKLSDSKQKHDEERATRTGTRSYMKDADPAQLSKRLRSDKSLNVLASQVLNKVPDWAVHVSAQAAGPAMSVP